MAEHNFYQHPERKPEEIFLGNVPVGFSTLTEAAGGSRFKYKREGKIAYDFQGIPMLGSSLVPFFGLESEYREEGVPGIRGVTHSWEQFEAKNPTKARKGPPEEMKS
jgi:hypothetical protein